MKPCAKNRKLLVWLTLDALDKSQARELRSHVEGCQGCRTYLEEISNVAAKMTEGQEEAALSTSPAFHRRVSAAIHTNAGRSMRAGLLPRVLAAELSRRLALPAFAAACLVLFLFVVMRQPASVSPPRRPVVRSPAVESEFVPTVANYQRVASDSVEKLDAVLNQQANRPRPAAPIYTASIVTVEMLED